MVAIRTPETGTRQPSPAVPTPAQIPHTLTLARERFHLGIRPAGERVRAKRANDGTGDLDCGRL